MSINKNRHISQGNIQSNYNVHIDITKKEISSPTAKEKSLGFLPDINFQKTGQFSMKRDKNNASSSINYRMTTTDSAGNNPFFQSIQLPQNAPSNSSSPSKSQNMNYGDLDSSTKFANKDFRNVRNYHNLYE